MRFLWIFLTCLLPLGAMAQDMSLLKQPGVVAFMRHALAPGTGDPAAFTLNDCTTQRNLDDRGRTQARRIGAAMRAEGVSFDAVWTSQWCRCRETAQLVDMGLPMDVPSLNSHFAGRGDRVQQTADTLALISELPEGERVLLVTHFVNISALTGQSAGSGEIIVTRRTTEGGLEVIGQIEIAP